MPTLTRWYVKTLLIYLVLSLLTGLVNAAQPVWGFSLPGIFPVYLHLLTIGWLTLLIFGVVFWMFPKYSREQPRRSDRLGWAVYITLNLGLILRAISEPSNTIQPGNYCLGLGARPSQLFSCGLLESCSSSTPGAGSRNAKCRSSAAGWSSSLC